MSTESRDNISESDRSRNLARADQSQAPSTVVSIARVRTALLLVQLMFGFHYLTAKIVVADMNPAAWASFRVWASFLVLALIALYRRCTLPSRNDILKLAGLSLIGITINQTLFIEGIARTTPAHASLICAMIPLLAMLVTLAMRQEKLTWNKGLSFVAGLAGVLILLRVDQFHLDNEYLVGDLLNLCNAASYALFIPLGRRVMQRNDPLMATTVMFFFGALTISLYGGGKMLSADYSSLSPLVISCMAYTILVATVATYFLNLWALRHTGASRVALYIFLQPVIASLVGIVVLGDAVSLRFLIAMVLVFCALLLREIKS